MGLIGDFDSDIRRCLIWAIQYELDPLIRTEACHAIILLVKNLQDAELVDLLYERHLVEKEPLVKQELKSAIDYFGYDPEQDMPIVAKIKADIKRFNDKKQILRRIMEMEKELDFDYDRQRFLWSEKMQEAVDEQKEAEAQANKKIDDSSNKENEKIKSEAASIEDIENNNKECLVYQIKEKSNNNKDMITKKKKWQQLYRKHKSMTTNGGEVISDTESTKSRRPRSAEPIKSKQTFKQKVHQHLNTSKSVTIDKNPKIKSNLKQSSSNQKTQRQTTTTKSSSSSSKNKKQQKQHQKQLKIDDGIIINVINEINSRIDDETEKNEEANEDQHHNHHQSSSKNFLSKLIE